MPKSKVRKKPAQAASRAAAARARAAAATPVKAPGPSGPVFLTIMVGLMVLGLLWIVTYYLANGAIGFMDDLGNWNLMIGFALMTAGLVMTMGWR